MSTPLVPGRIIWAELTDPAGRNPKRRPLVVLGQQADQEGAIEVIGVAITTHLPTPLPDDYVVLPWQRERRVRTRLGEPSAAVCSWVARVRFAAEQEIQHGGVVDGKLLQAIVAKVNALNARLGTDQDASAPPGDTP